MNTKKQLSSPDVPKPHVVLVLDQDKDIAKIAECANAYIRSRGDAYDGSLSSFVRAWTPTNPTGKRKGNANSLQAMIEVDPASSRLGGRSLVKMFTIVVVRRCLGIIRRQALPLVIRGSAVVAGMMSRQLSSLQCWLEEKNRN